MRIRKLAVLATSGLMLGGLVGSPAAWAHEADSHDGDDFTVFGRFTDFDHEDNGKEGWSEDDVITFAYDLFERGEGQVGDGDGKCTITKLDKEDRDFAADCKGVFDLDDGTLDLEGTVTDEDFHSGDIEMDIVDGTGDFEDANGTVTFSRAGRDGGRHSRWFRADVDLD